MPGTLKTVCDDCILMSVTMLETLEGWGNNVVCCSGQLVGGVVSEFSWLASVLQVEVHIYLSGDV